MPFIYKITNPKNKIYIGQTRWLKRRINEYKTCTGKKNLLIYNSIQKYGWDAHTFEVIEEVDVTKLDEREIFWINQFDTFWYKNKNGLNLTIGGSGQRSPWKHNKEKVKFYSEKFKGEGNPFYGKKHTAETRKAISEKRQQYNLRSDRWNNNIYILLYDINGCFISEFTSMKTVANHIGINPSSIRDALVEDRWVASKYKVRKKIENYPLKIDVDNVRERRIKRPVVCFINSFQLEYPSTLEASIDLGIPKTSIARRALETTYKPIKGKKYIFIYKDLHEKLQQAS